MHTEEEAKHLICPHLPVDTRVTSDHIDGELVQVRKYAECIGSKCSQWRWGVKIVYPEHEPEPKKERSFWDIFHPPKVPIYGPLPEIARSDKGYCGLAGKP